MVRVVRFCKITISPYNFDLVRIRVSRWIHMCSSYSQLCSCDYFCLLKNYQQQNYWKQPILKYSGTFIKILYIFFLNFLWTFLPNKEIGFILKSAETLLFVFFSIQNPAVSYIVIHCYGFDQTLIEKNYHSEKLKRRKFFVLKRETNFWNYTFLDFFRSPFKVKNSS